MRSKTEAPLDFMGLGIYKIQYQTDGQRAEMAGWMVDALPCAFGAASWSDLCWRLAPFYPQRFPAVDIVAGREMMPFGTIFYHRS